MKSSYNAFHIIQYMKFSALMKKVFLDVKEIAHIDNKKYIIESVKQNPNCEVIKFLGIDDISLTDEILKKEVYVNRNEINVDYLFIELMNMDVYDNDKLIGKVKEILLNKKYNYIKVHDIIIPITNNFIEKMDFENNIIYVKNMGDLNEN